MLKFERLPHGDGLPLPSYADGNAAGIDISAAEGAVIRPHTVHKMPTGFRIQPPAGNEVQVRARSGWASRGLGVANGVGTIDPNYNGEVFVLLVNFGTGIVEVKRGDRIAQLVIAPIFRSEIVEGKVEETDRGERGFGSTGR